METRQCKIMIVDDHTLFRNGLKTLLGLNPNYSIIGEASNGYEFLESDSIEKADIVLLDIDMPGMNGIEAAEKALKKYPEMKIITLSMFGEEDYYFSMISLGVKGFILKNSDIDEVQEAIDTINSGGSYFSQELLFNLVSNLRDTSQPSNHVENDELSKREREILLMICKGLSNQEIGDKLFISKRTVDKHRANILAKTNCKNTANLVVYAIKHKLVEI